MKRYYSQTDHELTTSCNYYNPLTLTIMFDAKEENVSVPLEVDSSAIMPSEMQDMSEQEQVEKKLVSYSLFGLGIHLRLVAISAIAEIIVDPIRQFILCNS